MLEFIVFLRCLDGNPSQTEKQKALWLYLYKLQVLFTRCSLKEAYECGLKGNCHVGFYMSLQAPEQRIGILLDVYEPLSFHMRFTRGAWAHWTVYWNIPSHFARSRAQCSSTRVGRVNESSHRRARTAVVSRESTTRHDTFIALPWQICTDAVSEMLRMYLRKTKPICSYILKEQRKNRPR